MAIHNNDNEEMSNLVYDKRFSSVVPGRVTGENNTLELKPMDLAMKFHYLKGLYFFPNRDNDDCRDLVSITELKKPMFEWLVSYFMVCGRVRASLSPPGPGAEEGGGRPVIKLNDSGIRIVVARSRATVREWLAMEGFMSRADELVYGQTLGPDLGFTPLVFVQITWFKCGGISVGLNWAHMLGDVFSASAFMNNFGRYLSAHYKKAQILTDPNPIKPKYSQKKPSKGAHFLKWVCPIGEQWVAPTNYKMVTHSLSLSSAQLASLISRLNNDDKTDEKNITQGFEVISAIMWKSLAKIRKDDEPNTITICTPKSIDREHVVPHNGQMIGTIKVNFSILGANLMELVAMISKNKVDESGIIDEMVRRENGKLDAIVFGANLTFVVMEDTNIYGFEVEGQSPIFASYTIGGVGEQGAILVLPNLGDGKHKDANGKLVIAIVREGELENFKKELKEEWSIV